MGIAVLEPVDDGIDQILAYRAPNHDATLSALLRHQPQAMPDSGSRRVDADRPPLKQHSASVRQTDTKEGLQEFSSASSDYSCNGQDLSPHYFERDVLEFVLSGQMLDRQRFDGRASLGTLKVIAQRSTDHRLDDVGLGHRADRGSHDIATVSEHRKAISELLDFFESVRNVNERNSLFTQTMQQSEETSDLIFRQGCGGFVQDENSVIVAERLGDLHQLLQGRSKLADQRRRCDVKIKIREQLCCTAIELGPVDNAHALQRFVPKKNILGNAHRRDKIELLVDDANAIGNG